MPLKSCRLLGTNDVAEILGCTRRHVCTLIRNGELEGIRVGRREYRIKKESVIIFMEKNRVDSEINFN
jgi:excisionase family DNA binding protein